MIKFKHYMKSALINSGTPSFREYTASIDKKRLIKFLDGSITELIPEDFGDLTEIKKDMYSYLPNVERIEMSDNITKIGFYSFCELYNIKEIIFSANITSIESNCLIGDDDSYQFNNNNIVLDFSKVTQIPHYGNMEAGGFVNNDCITTIKIPSSLYDDWMEHAYWSDIAKSKMVAV